jgi:hypothetical protein
MDPKSRISLTKTAGDFVLQGVDLNTVLEETAAMEKELEDLRDFGENEYMVQQARQRLEKYRDDMRHIGPLVVRLTPNPGSTANERSLEELKKQEDDLRRLNARFLEGKKLVRDATGVLLRAKQYVLENAET